MMPTLTLHDIYLETGHKKVFACAAKWPGWCRSGRDEASAINALINYAGRYAKIIKSTALEFMLPQGVDDFTIIERLQGNFSTDFGVPDVPIIGDNAPLSAAELHRQQEILKASWRAFDRAVDSARGRPLRKGPRGGGRQLDAIASHVAQAEKAYLRHLGWNGNIPDESDIYLWMSHVHHEILSGIQAAALGKFPLEGPRGGKRWPLAYFIRRAAWHVIDHTWEIEDRII